MHRGFEVHLPNFAPTSLIDNTLFGTLQDASNAANGIYYVTKDNHPWALNFTESFNHPIESVSIDKAFLHFFDWAKSGGASYKDWYKNTGAGYQNTSNIYNK
jgi:LruC domain-containing protein